MKDSPADDTWNCKYPCSLDVGPPQPRCCIPIRAVLQCTSHLPTRSVCVFYLAGAAVDHEQFLVVISWWVFQDPSLGILLPEILVARTPRVPVGDR